MCCTPHTGPAPTPPPTTAITTTKAPTPPPTTAITTTKAPTRPLLGDPCAWDARYGHLGTCASPSATRCWRTYTGGGLQGRGNDGWISTTTGAKGEDEHGLGCAVGLECCASWDRKTRVLACPVPTCVSGQCYDPAKTRCGQGGKDASVPCGGVAAPHACRVNGQYAEGTPTQRYVMHCTRARPTWSRLLALASCAH